MNPSIPLLTLIDLIEKKKKEKSLTLPFFFWSLVCCPTPLVPIMPNYQSIKKKLISTTTNSTLSLPISLIYIIQDGKSQTQTQSDRVTKPKSQTKKKKNTTRSIDSIHNQSITNISSNHTNMKHHKSTRHKHSFCESQILRSDHKHFIFIRF